MKKQTGFVHPYIPNSVPNIKADMLREIGVSDVEELYGAIPEELRLKGKLDLPEPFTPEPCESYSKKDCEYWAAVLEKISEEAYSEPEILKSAPHNATIHKVNPEPLDDPAQWAMTWRAFVKKRGGRKE